jgi:hypothetical protein
MLDPWIIEEIKRREQRGRIEQPVIQIPARSPEPRDPKPAKPSNDEDEAPRGVEIIELGAGGGPSYGW